MSEDKWAEDVYRELYALIRVYSEIENRDGANWCLTCNKAFNEPLLAHVAMHMADELGNDMTSTPPPEFS
jgi:hypothetical protein